MTYYELCVLKELVLKGYEPKDIIEKQLIDKHFRKELIKKYSIVTVNAIEQCVSDKTRMTSDKDYKTYKQREYDTGFIYPDEVIMKEHLKEYGYLQDTRLTETIYYNSTIPYIYHLKHLEYINGYREDNFLSFLELIYPAKMPTKDYFPFVEFDVGAKIPLPLTEEERHRYEEDLGDFSSLTIDEDLWSYCILWVDKDRMFMSLECSDYYFKQIGKNVHLFEIIYQCV